MRHADHLPPIQGSAYGLTIHSDINLRPLLNTPTPDLIHLTIDHHPELPDAADHLDHTRALITLQGGRRLEVQRSENRATLFGPAPDADEVAHPLLGAAATVVSRWISREVFHAGSFAFEGQALCVVGENHAGKSTLLSSLAARGLPVMADDLAFTDGHSLYAGPRTLDLRTPHDTHTPLRPVRDNRLRMTLPPAPPRLPLRGWILLQWAPQLSLEPIAATEVLPALIDRRSLRKLPSDPHLFLALATHPAWRLRRPPNWNQHQPSIDTLLTAIAT